MNRTLEESARDYQSKHENKTELKEVERITGEEEESNVLQVSILMQIVVAALILAIFQIFMYLDKMQKI